MTCPRVYNENNTTDATSGAGDGYRSGIYWGRGGDRQTFKIMIPPEPLGARGSVYFLLATII
jgi:hypothetical protein